MIRTILAWQVASDRAVSLLFGGTVVAKAWPDGRLWRVAAIEDSRPGHTCPTLDEARAAAMVIARNRVPQIKTMGGHACRTTWTPHD